MKTRDRHTYRMGVIGNCAYLALVDDQASVQWLCWPRFDSSFVLGGLLDGEKGGYFSIQPENGTHTTKQYYKDNTNILCTEFETEHGAFRVTDFAPRFYQYERYFKPLMLIRKIEPLRGSVRVKALCRPMGDYGRMKPEVDYGSNHIRYSGFERQLRLTTNIPLSYVIDEKGFALNEPKYLVLTWGVPLEAPLESTAEDFLRKTENYWQRWVKSCTIGDFEGEAVIRSALALKIHQYEDTGAIIAATTTSLPESPGSTRNWDYRYCWVRDTYYTLNALTQIGHVQEMEGYSHFFQNLVMTEHQRYQPLYSITADAKLKEQVLNHLAGYQGNQPVRIGNQAYEHIQNDVYGQILVSLLPLYADPRYSERLHANSNDMIYRVLSCIEKTMDEADAGLWEFRNHVYKHAYTFLFHWAGASAAIKIARKIKDEKLVVLATRLRDEAAKNIEACWDPELGAYTHGIGSKNLDASLLQLITMGYLDPQSDRAKSHLARLEKELMTENGLFYRYKHADDFGVPEVTFAICSFWYIEALAMVGRVEDAIERFRNVIGYSNHLGLLSEDIDPKSGSQWGNFPQAYSHVGLMNAAFRIAKKLDKPNFL